MKKRILSIALLALLAVALVLSLVGCGSSGSVRGFSVDKTVSNQYYDEQSGRTSLELTVFVTNESSTVSIRSYKYKVVFKDAYGAILDTKVYSKYEALEAYNTESFRHYFSVDDATAIKGNVASVEVYPSEMTVSNETKDEGGSSSGDTEWDFWTWFWVIISGVLIFLFISCCIGAEGDSDAIIGGVVIFLAPAILILIVYFGFFFG